MRIGAHQPDIKMQIALISGLITGMSLQSIFEAWCDIAGSMESSILDVDRSGFGARAPGCCRGRSAGHETPAVPSLEGYDRAEAMIAAAHSSRGRGALRAPQRERPSRSVVTVKLKVKRALGALGALTGRRARRRIVLLYLHALGESPFAMAERDFRLQIHWLASVAEILPRRSARGGVGCPTAGSDHLRRRLCEPSSCGAPDPGRKRRGCHRFPDTGWIGRKGRKASDPALGSIRRAISALCEVADLVAAGWEIGSHGVDHLDLTIASDEVTRRELRESRARSNLF